MSATPPTLTCVSAEPLPPVPQAAGFLSPRAQIVFGACACACASAFVYAVDPSRHAVYPQCLLYNTTGIYCAGCGATRAVYALLHGRLLDALHDNVLFVAALPLLLYLVGCHLLETWRANAWPAVFLNPGKMAWRGVAIFLVMIAFMIIRNLPGAPFDLLRPIPQSRGEPTVTPKVTEFTKTKGNPAFPFVTFVSFCG